MSKDLNQKLYDAASALVLDIGPMQISNDPDWFGDFSNWEETDANMVMIEWPNLAIYLDNIAKILKEIDHKQRQEE
jgi:hypothetical protein